MACPLFVSSDRRLSIFYGKSRNNRLVLAVQNTRHQKDSYNVIVTHRFLRTNLTFCLIVRIASFPNQTSSRNTQVILGVLFVSATENGVQSQASPLLHLFGLLILIALKDKPLRTFLAQNENFCPKRINDTLGCTRGRAPRTEPRSERKNQAGLEVCSLRK